MNTSTSNVVPLRTPNRPTARGVVKPKSSSAVSTACHKVADKDHTSVQWYTPPEIVRALGGDGGFDLDPCTPEDPTTLPARTAARMIPPSEDGLATPWPGGSYVWMNPPYGRGIERWLSKLASHPGGGIALVPANMDPAWMHTFVLAHPRTTALLFTRGRLKFIRPDGGEGNASPTGSVLVAYGSKAAANLKKALTSGALRGHYLDMARAVSIEGGAAANDEEVEA